METKALPDRTSSLLDFLVRLGRAYLASGEQTAKVEQLLREIAAASGEPHLALADKKRSIFYWRDFSHRWALPSERKTQSRRSWIA